MISMASVARGLNPRGSGAATHGTVAPASLAGDLMEGAEEIAEFLFGDRSKTSVQKVFYLASEVGPANRPPIFKFGNQKLAARRTRLLRWFEEREQAVTQAG